MKSIIGELEVLKQTLDIAQEKDPIKRIGKTLDQLAEEADGNKSLVKDLKTLSSLLTPTDNYLDPARISQVYRLRIKFDTFSNYRFRSRVREAVSTRRSYDLESILKVQRMGEEYVQCVDSGKASPVYGPRKEMEDAGKSAKAWYAHKIVRQISELLGKPHWTSPAPKKFKRTQLYEEYGPYEKHILFSHSEVTKYFKPEKEAEAEPGINLSNTDLGWLNVSKPDNMMPAEAPNYGTSIKAIPRYASPNHAQEPSAGIPFPKPTDSKFIRFGRKFIKHLWIPVLSLTALHYGPDMAQYMPDIDGMVLRAGVTALGAAGISLIPHRKFPGKYTALTIITALGLNGSNIIDGNLSPGNSEIYILPLSGAISGGIYRGLRNLADRLR